MNQLAKKIAFSLSLVIVGYVSLGFLLGKASDQKPYRSLTVFSEVLERIQEDYVDEPNMHLVTVGALHGLLESLDPESAYLSPREYADYKAKSEKLAAGDIGVVLSKHFGLVAVVSVLPDSPAQRARLHEGDLLEAIGGFTTREMSLGQAQVLLRGEPGTTVKISVVRRGAPQPQDIEMTRAPLAPARLLTERYEGDIAYVRVPAFNPGRAGELRSKLVELDRQGAHKLILDLRECALGDVSEGIAAAQLLLPSGTISTLKGQTIATSAFLAVPGKVVWKQPLVVLVSSGSAGAAEVLAAAVADNHRGETVGQTTFGTASQQKLILLPDGAALILTVANYFTPADKRILNEGVAPTVEVRNERIAAEKEEAPAGQLPSADDLTFKKALSILKGEAAKRAA